MVLLSAPASRNSGVMSLKTIPGFGKSGMSLMYGLRSAAGPLPRELAQVPDQQQVLQV